MPLRIELECACSGLDDTAVAQICKLLEQQGFMDVKVHYGLKRAHELLLVVRVADHYEHVALARSAMAFYQVLNGREINGTTLRILRA